MVLLLSTYWFSPRTLILSRGSSSGKSSPSSPFHPVAAVQMQVPLLAAGAETLNAAHGVAVASSLALLQKLLHHTDSLQPSLSLLQSPFPSCMQI